MTNRSIFLVAASVAALAIGVSSASAQDSGLYGSIGVGSTQVETSMSSLSPEGTTVEITAGDVFLTYDGWSIAAEASAAYSGAEASMRTQVCDVPDCGYDEWEDETVGTTWSAKLGFRVSRPVGPVVLSLGAGITAAEYTQDYHYDSNGVFPDYHWGEQGYGVGTYYDVSLAYPVTDSLSVVGTYGESDLTVREWSSSYGGNSESFETRTWTLSLKKRF